MSHTGRVEMAAKRHKRREKIASPERRHVAGLRRANGRGALMCAIRQTARNCEAVGDWLDGPQVADLRYGTARRSRNQNERPRKPQRHEERREERAAENLCANRVSAVSFAGRKFAPAATISGDTDRVQLCVTRQALAEPDGWGLGRLPAWTVRRAEDRSVCQPTPRPSTSALSRLQVGAPAASSPRHGINLRHHFP